ncbi:MAG: VOC family protein [Granulosicoccus sp.]|nr:VOC family protein [Granulosicoccus sp.]
MPTQLDHLVLGAETLEQGVRYIESVFGVTVPAGGEHPLYGTHNCVMQLGDDCYFEIIAINPETTPLRSTPRWYGLDNAATRARLSQGPELIAWVASVDDLSAVRAQAHWIDGEISEISRGSMHWQMLLPAAGSLEDPLLPWLIHWPAGQHPKPNLQSLGCSLVSLSAAVPEPQNYSASLHAIGAGSLLNIQKSHAEHSRVTATIQSPKGRVELPGIAPVT